MKLNYIEARDLGREQPTLKCRIFHESRGHWINEQGRWDLEPAAHVWELQNAVSFVYSNISLSPSIIFDVEEVAPERLTLEQAGAKPANTRCRIWHVTSGYWISIKPCKGHNTDRRKAVITTIGEALECELKEGSHLIELLRKVDFERQANPRLKALAMVAPNNSQVKGMILATFGCLPPDQTFTYDELKVWVEANSTVEMPMRVQQQSVGVVIHAANPVLQDVNLTNQTPHVARMEIPMEFSDDESGHCTYSVRRYGSGTYVLSRETMRELLSEFEGSTMQDLCDYVRDSIINDAWDNVNPNMLLSEENEDYNYGNLQSEDHENSDCSIDAPQPRLRQMIEEFIRQNFTQQELHDDYEFELPPLPQPAPLPTTEPLTWTEIMNQPFVAHPPITNEQTATTLPQMTAQQAAMYQEQIAQHMAAQNQPQQPVVGHWVFPDPANDDHPEF